MIMPTHFVIVHTYYIIVNLYNQSITTEYSRKPPPIHRSGFLRKEAGWLIPLQLTPLLDCQRTRPRLARRLPSLRQRPFLLESCGR